MEGHRNREKLHQRQDVFGEKVCLCSPYELWLSHDDIINNLLHYQNPPSMHAVMCAWLILILQLTFLSWLCFSTCVNMMLLTRLLD